MSDIKKLLEHIDGINSSTSSKKQLSEAGWTPNEAQRKWLGGADINDPFIIARMPAKLGAKPGIPDLPPADQEIAKQFNRGVDNANRIRSFFGLKTGANQPATQQSASANQSTPTLPSRSMTSTTDAQSEPQPGTTRPGLRIPFQLPDGKIDIVPSEVKTQTGIREPAQAIELNEIEMDESGLQAYLGNKKYGKDGMDSLRKAGREGASKEKMAKIRAKYDKLDEEDVAEGTDKLQGTPVVSLSDFGKKDTVKNKYGHTVPKKLKKDDPRVKFYKDEKKGVAEGGILKSIKRGLQGWGTGDAPTPKELVRRNKGYSDDAIKALARDTRNINPHTPGGLQKRVVDREMKKRGLGEQSMAEGKTQRSAADRLTRKFENYLSNRLEMLEGSYGSEKKKFKVEAAPTYPNAQDPNAQTTSPQPSAAQATKDEQDKKREQQVDIATAKGTMSGLKNVLGPSLDINQAASAVTKINDRKPLTGPEQQAMSAITPLLAKAAEMPQTASNLKTSLTNAAYLAKLGK